MSNNFLRSSKQNPCPVCDRTKDGDCSWYTDGQTVLCKSYVDGSGHDEQKWHYTGIADTGFQGKFILKTEKIEPAFVKATRPLSEKHYFYPDRVGNNLVRITRKDDGTGKKTFYQSHWDGGKWVKGCSKEVRTDIPIYRRAEVREANERGELIFIVEGEGIADRLWDLGIPATTTIGGSGGYANYGNYSEDLEGARLVLAPDRDANGVKYIANFECDFPTQIEGYYLAGTEGLWRKPIGGMDIGDDLQDHGYTKEQIIDRVVSTDKYRELTTTPEVAKPPKEKRATSGDTLLEIGKTATYFHTPDKVAYADITIDGNRHTYAVRSKAFRLWLTGEYFKQAGKGISAQPLQDALNTFEAIAIFDGETHDVDLRTAEYQEKIYLDLGTADWKAIEVDRRRWRIISDPPVRFWRPDSLNAKVQAASPRILGALLTALSQTLAELPTVKTDRLPRMADFGKFAIASEKALGLKEGAFMKIFGDSREESRQIVVESSPIGEGIISLMRDRLNWTGTTTELMRALEQHTDESVVRSRFYPKTPNLFKRQLNRLKPDLSSLEVSVSEIRKGIGSTKVIYLEKVIKTSTVSTGNSEEDFNPFADKLSTPVDEPVDESISIDRPVDELNEPIDRRSIATPVIDRQETQSQRRVEDLSVDTVDMPVDSRSIATPVIDRSQTYLPKGFQDLSVDTVDTVDEKSTFYGDNRFNVSGEDSADLSSSSFENIKFAEISPVSTGGIESEVIDCEDF